MPRTEATFGSRDRFSLKNRYWMKLVDSLALMQIQKDELNKHLYRFFNKERIILVKLYQKSHFEITERTVEFLDDNYHTLLKEVIVEAGSPATFDWHPLNGLFDLIDQNEKTMKDVSTIRTIVEILA